jgi:uncharacterized protein (DUF952 family)
MIYHITTPVEFTKFDDKDFFEASSLFTEGFIHCSTQEQLAETAKRYYSGTVEILVLEIDEEKLVSELRYELSRNGEEFPHIYGRINKQAIINKISYFNLNGNFNIGS